MLTTLIILGIILGWLAIAVFNYRVFGWSYRREFEEPNWTVGDRIAHSILAALGPCALPTILVAYLLTWRNVANRRDDGNGMTRDVDGFRTLPPFFDSAPIRCHLIRFDSGAGEIGRLWFEDGLLYFDGDLDQSTEAFFKTLKPYIDQYVAAKCANKESGR